MAISLIAILLCVSMASNPSQAHSGDKVYMIPEITDEMMQEIDLDGFCQEWEDLLGDRLLTPFDFGAYEPKDPSDLDFGMWLGWNDTNDRLYVAALFIDDQHVEVQEFSGPSPWECWGKCDYMHFSIDGDHSGEQWTLPLEPSELHAHAQLYHAIAQIPRGPNVAIYPREGPTGWIVEPPYSESGGDAFGEHPTVWSIEFYVTPFDLLILDEPEASIPSVLEAGKTIGFNIEFDDADEGEESGTYFLRDPNNWGPQAWVDGLLVGVGDGIDDSAVHADSWARIKASLGH